MMQPDDTQSTTPAQSLPRGLFARLRNYFFTGVVVTAPITLTFYWTYLFLLWVDSLVTPWLPPDWNPNAYLPFRMPGTGLVIVIAFFTLTGWFAKNFLGRMLIAISDYIVQRLPVINTVYKTLKQVFQTLMSGHSGAFREVVLVEFPRKGLWAIGFITGAGRDIAPLPGDDIAHVMLPNALNPTTANLVYVPRADLIFPKISVDEALKMIVSGGIIAPGETPRKA
jgi:uncharacterized membrane protein